MKKIQIDYRFKKNVFTVFALVVMCLSISGTCLAEEFVGVRVFPEHVGVFTTVRTQQFVAFAYTSTGSKVNITEQVGWESSDESIVTIDEKGLATVVAGKTFGQVKISCSYPKTGKLNTGVNMLLLNPPVR